MIALLAAARALQFISLMVIFGGSAFVELLHAAKLGVLRGRAPRILFACAATLAIFSAIVWFCLIAGQMSGSWQASVDPSTLKLAAFETRFGNIFLGRLIGLVLLWVLCVSGLRLGRLAMPVLAALLLASLAPISHAAAGGRENPIFGAINDAVHLLTAGFWLGGLVVLALIVSRRSKNPDLQIGALRLFSMWGSFVVGVLIITGLMNTVSILPSTARSLHNSYFTLLLWKVGLASIMVGLAAMNRWHFVPDMANDQARATRFLSVSIRTEIILGMIVVGIAGFLGLTPPY